MQPTSWTKSNLLQPALAWTKPIQTPQIPNEAFQKRVNVALDQIPAQRHEALGTEGGGDFVAQTPRQQPRK